MDRRAFIGTLAGGLLAAPLAAEAQQAVQAEFQRGMHALGYVDGSTWILHERYAENAVEKLPALAAELARLNVDVVVAEAYVGVQAALRATNAISIVFITGDPVGFGFVQSLEILKQTLPRLCRLAALQATVSRPAVVSKVVQEATAPT